jgi:hypothetical protein
VKQYVTFEPGEQFITFDTNSEAVIWEVNDDGTLTLVGPLSEAGMTPVTPEGNKNK